MSCARRSSGRAPAALIAAAACLALATAAFAAPPEEDAAGLLRASIDASRLVSYIGQLETIRFSANKASATIVRIEHRAPDRTRRWYLAPESLYGDYIITRSTTTWQFDTRRERVTTSSNPLLDVSLAAGNTLELLYANYRAVPSSGEIVAGRPTISLVLINKYTGERVARIWIDSQTKLVLRKETFHADGSIATASRFEELRYTEKIPDDIFSTNVPDGYTQVTEAEREAPSLDLESVTREAGFKPASPADLPEGFALVGSSVETVNGVKTVHLNYSDGLRTLSLFENAAGAEADFGLDKPRLIALGEDQGKLVEHGSTTLIAWKEKQLTLMLIGDLSRAELARIAASVIP
jgi:sigma-E factor negative regulatory protein RseB